MTVAVTDFPPADFVLPSTEAEEWRYSRIGDLDLAAYAPATSSVAVVSGGEFVSPLADHPDRGALLGRAVGASTDAFVDLNAALSGDAIVVDVPAGTVVHEPIELTHLVEGGGITFPRVVVRVGEDAEVTVVERSATDAVDAVVVPVTELIVGRAARVKHVGFQDAAESVAVVGRIASVVDASATLDLFHVALGGSYARMRFDCGLVGRGASGNICALYLGSRTQMHDLRTFQDHLAPDTTSNLLFKGAVDDEAHAVYTGLIRISEDGRGSNATQSNRIVKLSPEAWAESVPNLEIHHNDVRCSHASAVGPIDPDQRFYLESRGVPPEAAERLVVNGFFREVIAAFPVTSVAEAATAKIAEELA
jgi:Fe-S cluster assembly protein SufD